MRFYFYLLTLVILFVSSSCSSTSSSCEDAVLEQTFSDATDRITDALINADPTDPDSCSEFKKAFDDYIDELEGLQDCANDAGEGAEWRELIEEARDSLGSIGC